MTKTINLNGITAVKIKQSVYDMNRLCRVRNFSGADIFASCENPECTENADGVRRISAGEVEIIDTENYDTIYLNGNGSVEIVTSAYAIFRRNVKGGGNVGDLSVAVDGKWETNHVDYNWIILENGLCERNDNYRIDCYDVSMCSQVYIKIGDPKCVFVWQNDYNVTSKPPTNIIGSPVVSGKSGYYNVPYGATWVCFSAKDSNEDPDTVTGVYYYHVNGIPVVNE